MADPTELPVAIARPEMRADAGFALGIRSSFSERAWRFRDYDSDIARRLQLMGVGVTLAPLLAARGLTHETVQDFLAPTLKTLLPDPAIIAHMEQAAARFANGVMAGETIAVFGDYDVDGAASAAQLLIYLRTLNREPLLYVPDRLTEGYGPSAHAMRILRGQGAGLVVTVDCGAVADEAFAAARDVGLDAIVLDHHATEKNPPVIAHVNPNGPDDLSGLGQVCAAGLVFLFLVAVQRALRQRGWFAKTGTAEPDLLRLLDIVALATVADVVPLTGVNRAFVRQGLRRLEALERPGLAALARLAAAQPPFSAYHLGFVFGPRINAGGRVGRCDLGARLLASTDADEAEALALELDGHNRERQAIEAGILEAATAMAMARADDPFLLVAGDGWHAGVVGIVAGRLKERFAKPVLVAGFDGADIDATARGSARSVAGVDLGAVIRAARSEGHLEVGGGHAMAAGFTVTRAKLESFRAFLALHLGGQLSAIAAGGALVLDTLVSAGAATPDLLAELDRAGPYGSGNPEPLFLLPDMMVAYAGIVGSNHVRLRLTGLDGAGLGAILFRGADTKLGQALLKARGKTIHAVGRLKRDDYGGTVKAQLHLEDAAAAGA
jgi:single-stranded-DNA-specific exonuclease